MLQFYDTPIAALALAIAAPAAFASPAGPAQSAECRLEDGLAQGPDDFLAEAAGCLATDQNVFSMEAGVRSLTDRLRAKEGEAPLRVREALNEAARLHAMDMAARSYAAHADLEGRSHLDRVRLLDRTLLIGAFGANVGVVETNDPVEAFNTLLSDPVNRENAANDSYTHQGVGVARADGRTYIVQLFAQADGELREPLPLKPADKARLTAAFTEPRFEHAGWRVRDGEGRTLTRGLGRAFDNDLETSDSAYLEIAVLMDGREYWLKGPAVAGN